MKLCVIELFLIMRKQDYFFEYIDQAIIAIIIIIFIVIFQILLIQITRSVKKYKALAVINNNIKKNTVIKKAIVYNILTQFKSFFVLLCSINNNINSKLNTVSKSIEKS